MCTPFLLYLTVSIRGPEANEGPRSNSMRKEGIDNAPSDSMPAIPCANAQATTAGGRSPSTRASTPPTKSYRKRSAESEEADSSAADAKRLKAADGGVDANATLGDSMDVDMTLNSKGYDNLNGKTKSDNHDGENGGMGSEGDGKGDDDRDDRDGDGDRDRDNESHSENQGEWNGFTTFDRLARSKGRESSKQLRHILIGGDSHKEGSPLSSRSNSHDPHDDDDASNDSAEEDDKSADLDLEQQIMESAKSQHAMIVSQFARKTCLRSAEFTGCPVSCPV